MTASPVAIASVAATTTGAEPAPAATNASTASMVRPQSVDPGVNPGMVAPLRFSCSASQSSAACAEPEAWGGAPDACMVGAASVSSAASSSAVAVRPRAALFMFGRCMWVLQADGPGPRTRSAWAPASAIHDGRSRSELPRGAFRLVVQLLESGGRTHGCGTASARPTFLPRGGWFVAGHQTIGDSGWQLRARWRTPSGPQAR